ncbi:uncharacterized protein LOC136073505 [Hydra vulgaris]|uniref:uncharacterized protein LOC136073505 n=1 Tax=Hydra vulgaris TaxID=6087 RepID=UPI0032EA74AF
MKKAKNNVIQILNINKGSKISIDLLCKMESTDIKKGETISAIAAFKTKAEVVLESTSLNDFYERAEQRILELLAAFQRTKSNSRFVSVKKTDIDIIEYKPIKGKSYIPLPKELASKKAIINMKNEDNECFKWCVARFFNPKYDHPERVEKDLKEQDKKLYWEKIEFPVSLHQITQFEKNNQDISINVFGYESSVYPLRISNEKNRQHKIDLLLISNNETNHYCLIKSLSRLLSSQISNNEHTRHFCRNCLQAFSSEESLSKHKLYCVTHDSVRIELLKPNTMIQFNHFKKTMRVPFVVYAGFESIIKPINTCEPNSNSSYTKQYQKHTPSSFCYYIKCFDESVYQSKLVTFTASNEDEDVAQRFIDMLEEDVKKIYNDHLKFPKKMIFTIKDKKKFDDAKICHICENELGKDRVRDHCHITGKYRGAAHSDLNEFTNKENKVIEVILQLRFLDSFRFMASSLDSLTKNLTKEQCKNVSRYYSGNELNLLLRKGVYPYEWVDSIDKLNETQLPSKESFYLRLNDEGISDENYLHGQTVWEEFQYPAWYYTSPGLAWDAALKETKVQLELLSDYDMILMIKQGIRGGISTISNRLGVANNKYMENYDKSKESTYIQYLDANNLYGWAMSKPLPTHGFKWMNEKEIENWKSTSCILEVDLGYPEHLHDLHNDYPLAPERLKINKVEKLVSNINHKKNYIIHYENLKLYERLGLKLTKIHRGIKFEESAWLSKYIKLNTDLITKATNDFEKNFFKLMNNSVFGKTMENIENRVDVRLVTKEKKLLN